MNTHPSTWELFMYVAYLTVGCSCFSTSVPLLRIFYLLLLPSLHLQCIPHLLLQPHWVYHRDASTFSSHWGFLLLLFSFHSPRHTCSNALVLLISACQSSRPADKNPSVQLVVFQLMAHISGHTHTHTDTRTAHTQHKRVSFITQYVIPSGMLLGRLLTDKQISDSSSGKM